MCAAPWANRSARSRSATCGRVVQRPLDVLGDVLVAGQDPFRLRIAEPGPAADQAAIRGHRAVRRDLDRHRPPVDVRPQAAKVGGQPLGEHRLDHARQVHRASAQRRLGVQRRAGRHPRRHVGDVDEQPEPLVLALDADRVVEVPRIGRIDREAHPVAEVDPDALGGVRPELGDLLLDRLRPRRRHTLLDRDAAQHGAHVVGPPQPVDDATAAAPVRLDRRPGRPPTTSPAPRLPSVSGAPNSKNGSATSSRPRRPTSQTTGAACGGSSACVTRAAPPAPRPASRPWGSSTDPARRRSASLRGR